MSEEIDRQILRKYDIQSKLGKGVRTVLAALQSTLDMLS